MSDSISLNDAISNDNTAGDPVAGPRMRCIATLRNHAAELVEAIDAASEERMHKQNALDLHAALERLIGENPAPELEREALGRVLGRLRRLLLCLYSFGYNAATADTEEQVLMIPEHRDAVLSAVLQAIFAASSLLVHCHGANAVSELLNAEDSQMSALKEIRRAATRDGRIRCGV